MAMLVHADLSDKGPIIFPVANVEAKEAEDLSTSRYNSLAEQFSQKGYHLKLTQFVAFNIGSNIIVDHVYTHWLDQLDYITVRTCYKVEDRKGNVSLITVQANVNNNNKILKYEVR
jgi:hypothetical protein